MRRSIRAVLAVVGLGVLAASCDEGRLVSGPGGVLEAEVQPITGRSSINAGEVVEFSTAILLSNGSQVTDAGAVQWSAEPASAVTFPEGTTDYMVTVRGRAPAAKVTLKAEVNHALLQAETKTFDVEILILGVEATHPADGDTSITAIGDAITLRARGIAEGGASADSGGVTWTHRGSNTQVLTNASRDTLRVQAESAGTDTFFVAREGQCTGKCADTVVVRVEQRVDSIDVAISGRTTFTAFGQTTQFGAQPLDANGNQTPHTVSWTVADAAVASIDETGLVTAVGNGTTTVTAAAGGVEKSVAVSVAQVAKTATVTPNPLPTTLLGGDTLHLAVAATDSNDHAIVDPTVTWSSANGLIATVDGSTTSTTVVTAQPITAMDSTWVRAALAGRRDSVQVRVGVATLTTVEVTPENHTIVALTATARLTAVGLNQNGSAIPDETFAWLSRDTDVATVDEEGLVTAVAPGSVHVIATSDTDATKLDSALVVVEQVVASVTVSPESHTFSSLEVGQEFKARGLDAEGHNVPTAKFTWSDDPLAIIGFAAFGTSDSTVTATSKKNGTVTFTATETSGATGSTSITVSQVAAAISVTPETPQISADDTQQLSATVTDANSQEIVDAAVDWLQVTGESVATVSASGLVTPLSVGSAKIIGKPSGTTTVEPDTSFVTVVDYSLDFDGGDDFGEVTSDPLKLSGDGDHQWTIEMWVRADALTGTQYLLHKGDQAIFGSGSSQNSSYAVILDNGTPRLVTRAAGGGSPTTQTSVGSTLTADTWTHIAFVFNAGTATLYVNGTSKGSTAGMSSPKAIMSSVFIGSLNTSSGFFDGHLDEIRVWSTARTAADIQDSRSVRLNGDETGLLAYWKFTAGSGNPVDATANGLTILLGGTAGTDVPLWSTDSPF